MIKEQFLIQRKKQLKVALVHAVLLILWVCFPFYLNVEMPIGDFVAAVFLFGVLAIGGMRVFFVRRLSVVNCPSCDSNLYSLFDADSRLGQNQQFEYCPNCGVKTENSNGT